jgi:hypothetical protein
VSWWPEAREELLHPEEYGLEFQFDGTFRPRQIALAYRPLQINEINRRIGFVAANSQLLDSIGMANQHLIRDAADELDRITIEGMEFNLSTVAEFIKEGEREEVSLTAGIHYGIIPLEETYWEPVYDAALRYLETPNTGEYWFAVPYNLGARARNVSIIPGVLDEYVGCVKRTRLVLFEMGPSTINAFSKDHKERDSNYERYLDDVINEDWEVISPAKNGTAMYEEIAKYLIDEPGRHELIPYDGSAWESNAGYLLRKSFSKGMTVLKQFPTIASGEYGTKQKGTLGMRLLFKNLVAKGMLPAPDLAVCNNDDYGAIYLDVNVGKNYPQLPGLITWDIGDRRYQYTTGFSFNRPYGLGPAGIHLGSDNSKNIVNGGVFNNEFRIPNLVGEDVDPGVVRATHSIDERRLYLTWLTTGNLAGRSTRDILKEADRKGWIAPSILREELLASAG